MSTVLTISGSPSAGSRAALLVAEVNRQLAAFGHDTATLHVRELSTVALLTEHTADPGIAAAVARVAAADGLVVVTPVYRAAYSGLVKSFLDLLSKKALVGKPVLPVATGGTQGHVVAIEYALRPLLAARGATRVSTGLFVGDNQIDLMTASLAPNAVSALLATTTEFHTALVGRAGGSRPGDGRPGDSQPGDGRPDDGRTSAATSGTSRASTDEPSGEQTSAAESDAFRSGGVRPDGVRPDGGRSGALRSDLVRAEAGRAGAGRAEANRSGVGRAEAVGADAVGADSGGLRLVAP
ncbi:NAD(P)H-dependent oxidoreductase [Goodfellowiella coeruleoviolacea]|uniref:FMN reductase, SsuE family n=1 Tax=Goodfellowiella coeruleoviolacea TaxID=334858 RepID=A0AAE3GH58_9PSEU|nr:NAD(P)H-dependent oxidoreductase [Goodfellowiella coeruleoviolacea]MCP2168167.1 FMN reductase, SsuE family [Goodfellowiella coeruleoviolacea]